MKRFVMLLYFVCGSYSIYYDAYHGTPISKEELKRHDKFNTTVWCVADVEPCDPNEGRRLDGSCNNLANPARGAGHTPSYRVLPAVFDTGFEPRKSKSGNELPLARFLRTSLLSEGRVPSIHFTQLAMHFMAFMSSDVTSQHDTVKYMFWKHCCAAKGKTDHDCVPNKIPDNDPVHRFSDIRCMNMTRPESFQSIGCVRNDTTPDRITTATPLLDLSTIYGSLKPSQKSSQAKVRHFKGGLLKYEISNDKIWPPSTKTKRGACVLNQLPHETRCHDTLDIANNALAGINLVSIWFWRMHNEIATQLAQVNPCWDDEKLFTTARDINIAVALQIYYYEMMPLLLGRDNMVQDEVITPSLGFRDIYNSTLWPQLSLEYPYVLRWLHTMQEGSMRMYDTKGYYLKEYPIVNLTMRTGFFDVDDNIVHMTQGSFRQASAASDYIVDPDIAEIGLGPHQRALDLASNDVAKGRFFGFQPYIKYRQFCFGKSITTFDELADFIDAERIEILKRSYENVEDIDLMAGIWVEKPIHGGHTPATFYCLVVDQMIRNVVSDRHWFERPGRPNAFTLPQLLEIRQMTMARVLCDVGDQVTEIQPKAFLRVGPGNRIQSCNQIDKIDYWMWKDPTCPPNINIHDNV